MTERDEKQQRTISVFGRAELNATPDRARISAGVQNHAWTASEALEANSEAMQKVIGALKARGVEPNNIQTGRLGLRAVYTWPKDGEEQRFTGYSASNSVTVKMRDLDAIGEVLDAVVTNGANRIDGVSFIVSDADRLLDAVRVDAVKDAERKARMLAEAAGARVGKIMTISEYSGGHYDRAVEFARHSSPGAAPPIEAGEETLSVTLQTIWELE